MLMNQSSGPSVVLAIAGSDSSGGAGIQADLKAAAALGAYAATVITATTAQNTLGVRSIWAPPPEHLQDQIDAVMQDLPVRCIKVGMVGSAKAIKAIAESLARWTQGPGDAIAVVLDPVMVASSGASLLQPDARDALIEQLIPLASIITPNLPEAAALIGANASATQEALNTVGAVGADTPPALLMELLQKRFPRQHILLKDGHGQGAEIQDLLSLAPHTASSRVYRSPRIDSRNTHGTGCTLSSAIASLIAQGHSWEDAVGLAQAYVHRAIEASQHWSLGHGHGPLQHFPTPPSTTPH